MAKMCSTFEIEGRPKPRVNLYANVNNVSSDYLKTMEIPLLRGRLFNPEETHGSQHVAMIDETLAKR